GEASQEGGAAALAAGADPGAAGQAPGGHHEFGEDVQAEVVRVQVELGREGGRELFLDLGAVVLGVPEQGGLGGDEAAGGEEALVPGGVKASGRSGERAVQLGEDGPLEVAVR